MDSSLKTQTFLGQKDMTLNQLTSMTQKLNILRKIARNRRASRSSCEMFDKNEVIFQLDELSVPINIGVKKRIESQKIVQEFMIMTNYEVAKKLVKDFGANSLLLYHPKPLN